MSFSSEHGVIFRIYTLACSQPRSQDLFTSLRVGREKALASAGHVSILLFQALDQPFFRSSPVPGYLCLVNWVSICVSPSDIGQPFTNVSFLCTERGYDDCLLGSQIDGYYRYEPFGGKREELDIAATKIQATFRGHKARQEAQTSEKTANNTNLGEGELPLNTAGDFGGKEYGAKEDAAATSIQAGYRGYYSRKKFTARNEAATTIQAGYRGYAVRKSLQENEVWTKPLDKADTEDVVVKEEEEAAAIKIQSAFRGHQTRNAIRGEMKSNSPADRGIEDNEVDSSLKDGSVANEQGDEVQKANDSTETEKDEAATKIQSSYRGYHTRKQLKQKGAAATTIQAHYRGYRVREIRRAKSEAAVKIQSYYRGYKTRERLGKRHSTKTFLDVSTQDEFALHRDSRTSFSLPEGVKFEGNLDEDSDAEIDKMVDKLTAIKEASSPETADEKHDG